MTPADRPVTCLLYPLVLNRNGTLVLHHRAQFPSLCRGNHGTGPPVYVALRDHLTALFGAETYAYLAAEIAAGRDPVVDVPDAVVDAYNRERVEEAADAVPAPRSGTYPPDALTPVERHGEIWLKRDDLCSAGGARGGKARTCWALATTAQPFVTGLVTASSRSSPQAEIVARVAATLGVPAVVHTPTGDVSTGPVARARDHGAVVVQHVGGYTNVLNARARETAAATGYRLVPFGMEHQAAVQQTAAQVANLPAGARRVVVAVGSGMSLAGILVGLEEIGAGDLPVLGVVVGADPRRRLQKYAGTALAARPALVRAGVDYAVHVPGVAGGVDLDPVYEAKVLPYLAPGDVFWVVGHRDPFPA